MWFPKTVWTLLLFHCWLGGFWQLKEVMRVTQHTLKVITYSFKWNWSLNIKTELFLVPVPWDLNQQTRIFQLEAQLYLRDVWGTKSPTSRCFPVSAPQRPRTVSVLRAAPPELCRFIIALKSTASLWSNFTALAVTCQILIRWNWGDHVLWYFWTKINSTWKKSL